MDRLKYNLNKIFRFILHDGVRPYLLICNILQVCNSCIIQNTGLFKYILFDLLQFNQKDLNKGIWTTIKKELVVFILLALKDKKVLFF